MRYIDYSDRKYVIARNKLIPEAARFADNLHGDTAGDLNRNIRGEKWNAAFHIRMAALAREHKLTGPGV